jgi:hypothetical protein
MHLYGTRQSGFRPGITRRATEAYIKVCEESKAGCNNVRIPSAKSIDYDNCST